MTSFWSVGRPSSALRTRAISSCFSTSSVARAATWYGSPLMSTPSRFSSVTLRIGLRLRRRGLVDREVAGDREQPGGELLRVAVGRREAERAEEDLLADRLDVLEVAEHAVEVRQDRRAVPLVEDRKRLPVAVLRAAHQLFVAEPGPARPA